MSRTLYESEKCGINSLLLLRMEKQGVHLLIVLDSYYGAEFKGSDRRVLRSCRWADAPGRIWLPESGSRWPIGSGCCWPGISRSPVNSSGKSLQPGYGADRGSGAYQDLLLTDC